MAWQTRRDIRSGERIAPPRVPEGRQSVLPMHSGEMKTGTVEAIKKQLGLK